MLFRSVSLGWQSPSTIRLGRRRRAFSPWASVRADNLAKYVMTERSDGGFARRQAVLRQQGGNRPIRGALLSQLDDDILGRDQVLELLRPERRKFRHCLADCGWIK